MTMIQHSLRHRPVAVLMGIAINVGGAAVLLAHLS